MLNINSAAVVGAGTMGAQIAAHLANVGIPVLLLDVAPTELTPEEKAAGLTLAAPMVRNRIVRSLFERMTKLSPSPLFTREAARLITLGNIEDDLPKLATADWVIEAVLERLDLKRELHAKIARHARHDVLVTTNTSGLPLHRIAEDLPAAYRRRFFATHFFNPPRYMRLLEIVPMPETDPEAVRAFTGFAETVLGKGVVLAKDTPCFIANRIGCFDLLTALGLAQSEGLEVEQIDALTGPLIGRPASATFRLCDVVGIDLMVQLAANLRGMLPAEEMAFVPPPFLEELVRRGWHGEKKGQGFYRRVSGEKGREIHALDLVTFEYRAQRKPAQSALASLVKLPAAERLRAVFDSGDPMARVVWKHLSAVLCYAADHIPEIADDLAAVDQAMRWGYNWELGPFEIWDAIGVTRVVRRLEGEGRPVPALARELVSSGGQSFYERRGPELARFSLTRRAHDVLPRHGKELSLARLRSVGRVVDENEAASLLDLGDGVACLQFRGPMNVIGEQVFAFLPPALDRVRRDFAGLVIGNEGPHFSAGANLKQVTGHIETGRWDAIESMIRRFQGATSTLRQFDRPVVAAVHGYTLGGGCEFALGCHHVVAFAETQMGLPEVGVGLIPGAHGTKEMLVRCTESFAGASDPDYIAAVRQAWETIGQAKISTSAPEAARLRYLRGGEWTLVLNRERVIGEAKARVLQLAGGHRPQPPRSDIPAVGQTGLALLQSMLHAMLCAGHISEHDRKIGLGLARILCGGDLTSLQFVTESYILELEREVFLSLCGEPKTLERIRHTLQTGKSLKN